MKKSKDGSQEVDVEGVVWATLLDKPLRLVIKRERKGGEMELFGYTDDLAGVGIVALYDYGYYSDDEYDMVLAVYNRRMSLYGT